MFIVFICTVLLNFTFCVASGDNEIESELSVQCDQHDDIFDPSPVRVHERRKRAVSSETSRLWPHGIIPYVIQPGIPDEIVKTLVAAMEHWTDTTCVRFTRKTDERDFVSFHNGVNCCSWVGRVGGKQSVSVGSRCSTFGVLIHELGHVIGFWHEHSRPDRDYYIKVISENLVMGAVRQFEKLPSSRVNSFGKLYDYESVMHYGPRHFSSNWKNTIETRISTYQDNIGQRDSLSEGDIEQANILYNCPRHPSSCRSMVRGAAGRVSSPNYPQPYGANHDCLTIIQPEGTGYVLIARILDIQIPGSTNCSTDFVEIRDGPHWSSPLLARLCGSTKPEAVVSTTGILRVRFRSDAAVSGRGFLLEFETQDENECMRGDNGGCSHTCTNTPRGSHLCSCPHPLVLAQDDMFCIEPDMVGSCSGIMTGESGIISNIGYPSGYMGGLSCYWMIYPPRAKEIQLTFHDFDLESDDGGSECLSDFLQVNRLGSSSGTAPERYCGKTLPSPIISNATRLTLQFSSDSISMLPGRGFLASYTTLSKQEPVCEEQYGMVSGEVTYRRADKDCDTWTYIIALPSEFVLSYKYSGALASGSSAAVYRGPADLLTTYTRHIPSPVGARTLSSYMKVVVNSVVEDDSFTLSWTSKDKGLCGGSQRVTKLPQNLYSHRFFNETELAPFQTCVWQLTTNKHQRIIINFLTFDINSPRSDVITSDSDVISNETRRRHTRRDTKRRRSHEGRCLSSYLEIIDGRRKIGKFCDDRKQSVYVSKSSKLKLKLVTKEQPGKGFHIKFSRLT